MIDGEYDLVVVGASVAAEALITRMRELGDTRSVLVIDRDERMPYERPPLSKLFLTRPDDIDISVAWDAGVPVVTAEATGVDPGANSLEVKLPTETTPRRVRYGSLVIATGASPVSLPIEPPGVLRLRTVDDSANIRRAGTAGNRVGIIGAGAIGSELATSLRTNGADVVLLDKADRPLERLLVGHLGADVTSWLMTIGVDCRWGVDIESIAGAPGNWTVVLGDGSVLAFDALISAVGARPITAWLEGSGLLIEGQLVCDADGRVQGDTGATNVYAIGDVVTRELAPGERTRSESWSAATEHGTQLAEHLTGHPIAIPELAYFWTDVAGRKVQVLGTLSRNGAIEVEFENPSRGAVLYKVSGDNGDEGWIGVNAQPKIAMLRMAR